MRATVVHRAATAVRQWLCFALVAVIPSIGSADTATGLTWLQSQVQAGGQLASVSSAATFAQSRCEVARTLRRERIYFAGAAEDEAIFAAYALVTQEEIAAPPGVRGAALRAAPGQDEHAAPGGRRTINERAGDEFV